MARFSELTANAAMEFEAKAFFTAFCSGVAAYPLRMRSSMASLMPPSLFCAETPDMPAKSIATQTTVFFITVFRLIFVRS